MMAIGGNDAVSASVSAVGQPMRPTLCDVLLLDDDVLVLEVTAEILRDLGFAVVEARNSRDALARFDQDDQPRILVTDVDIREIIDGRDVAQRALVMSPGLLVIYITGRPDRFWGTRLGNHERLVPKPFRPSELLTAIRQVGTPEPA